VIPVLICPVVSRYDLLERMIASIDSPVDRLIVVDNGLTGYTLPTRNPYVERVDYIRPILGLGYPGGINAGILQTPDARWWMWASNDLVFGPGDLAHVASLVESARSPRFVTGDLNDDRLLRNAYAAMNAATVDAVGLFDEWAFYPIYFDDNDYFRRCELGGIEWVEYNGSISHDRSSTIKDPHLAEQNSRTFQMNRDRYVAKWGGLPGHECYSRPYDLPVPLSYTAPDIAGRAVRTWNTR
jgi:GT2 family glycosyltransferase